MNRKIAALALVAATLLLGACGSNEPDTATESSLPPEAPTTTWAPEDLALVEVPVAKPAAGAPKVEPTALPEELSNFTTVSGLSSEQQDCMTGAMKAALDADPTLNTTPGKRASLSSTALTICEGSTVFTDPLLDSMAAGQNESIALTPAQITCFKQAFAADKANTAKVIAAAVVMGSTETNADSITAALAPFEAKCGAKIGAAFTGGS